MIEYIVCVFNVSSLDLDITGVSNVNAVYAKAFASRQIYAVFLAWGRDINRRVFQYIHILMQEFAVATS